METLTISLKETFRKGIANTKISSVCQFGDADYLICTKNQVYHYSAFKDSGNYLSKLNFLFKTAIFIKELNIICAIGSSLPNIIFLSTRSGFPLICEAYRLSSSLYDTIQYSPKTKKLIVSGDSVEIFDLVVEWKLFEIDPMITLVNKLSFSCERMTSNVFLDEMRQILIIPSLFGISTVDMSKLKGSPNNNLNHAVSTYQLGNIPFQTMAFYNSPKISKQRTISNIPFKYLITTNSNGDISLWNSSSIKTRNPIHNFKKLNEKSILCEFIDNEFCLFVTESKPNYFVILFDVKTGKIIKLTSFDTKVIKMNVSSKKSVMLLTEDFFVVYQLNIPWHLFSKTASNAVSIRRYPTFSTNPKAARVTTLFNDGIVSLFSPDVHFLITEIGTTYSSKIIDYIYDRSSSLRVRDKIISIENIDDKFFNTQNHEDLDMNTSNFENKTVSFNFTNNFTNKTENDTDDESNSKCVNFCPSVFQLRKRQQIRKFSEIGERFIFLLDDGTIQIFHSENDYFKLLKSVSTVNLFSLALTYIKEENDDNYEPTFIGFNKEGELLSFRFDNFEVLTRTAVTTNVSKGKLCPLFVCLHHQSNSIYAVYENQILIIDSSTKKVIHTEHLNSKPRFASLEDNLFLIVYENRMIQLRHLDESQQQESIKLLENVTFAIVQYETYIIVTDDKTVRIGHTFDNCVIFEFPFKIFSAGFLNPELDIALGLDFEIMVIRRTLWYPFISIPFNCSIDSSDPKTENYITAIHEKAVLYNIKEEENGSSDSNSEYSNGLSYSSSSSSLSENTGNALFLMSQKTNKSSTSFVTNSNKIISHHKSTPNIVKLKPFQSNRQNNHNIEGSPPYDLISRKKKLPELRSNEETMKDKKFMALFKDVDSGLNEGRKQSIFINKNSNLQNDEIIDDANKKNSTNDQNNESKQKISSNNKTKPSKINKNTDDENHTKRKIIKKKKRIIKKTSDDEDEDENNNDFDLSQKNIEQEEIDVLSNTSNIQNNKDKAHLRPKPPPEPINSSPNPRSQNKKTKEEIETNDIISNENDLQDIENNSNIGNDNQDINNNENSFNTDENKIENIELNINKNNECKVANEDELINNNDDENNNKKEINSNGDGYTTDNSLSKENSSILRSNVTNDKIQNKDEIEENIKENEIKNANKNKIQIKSDTLTNCPSNTRKFMKLGAKNQLTMSSPDLILLQAQLGKVKLTVENNKERNNKNSTFSENKINLPLITVHLIQKTISRTKSEYNLIRSIDQSIFKIENETNKKEESGTIGIQIERLMKTKNHLTIDQEVEKMQQQRNENKKTVLFSIKPLFANEKQPKRKENSNKKRLELLVPRRGDRQPLGNVELAIQVFRPNGSKK